MKRYMVNTQWHHSYIRKGFLSCTREYCDTVEEAKACVEKLTSNVNWQIKDRETKKILDEGVTTLDPDKYGF